MQLTHQQITARLEEYLEVEFTFIRADELAHALSPLREEQQRFVLAWVKSLACAQVALAHRFIVNVTRVIDKMDRQTIEEWAAEALDVYDRAGLHAAMAVITQVDEYTALSRERKVGAVYSEYRGVLGGFAHGLPGRALKVAVASHVYTDSETIYLPKVVSLLDTPADNFNLMKAIVAMQWAQTRFGTFRHRPLEALQQYSEPAKAVAIYHQLETYRLEACIERELPGLARRMRDMKARLRQRVCPPAWEGLAAGLRGEAADARDSLALVGRVYGGKVPSPVCYQGELRLDEVESVMQTRMAREKALLRMKLADLRDELRAPGAQTTARAFTLKQRARRESDSQPGADELTLDGVPITPPDAVRDLLTSVQLDFGHIPAAHLTPAGPGEYDPRLFKPPAPDSAWQSEREGEGAAVYDEWDAKRGHYRKNWCVLREREGAVGDACFAAETLQKYHGFAARLRKTFEAMRDEDRRLKRQADGDDVDIDALVRAKADAADGSEMTDRLFTRARRTERNIAVAFMVDMSGSTRGWINTAERESLVLLCEALERLGDRYAIYGFSGNTRKKCDLYRVKTFSEDYSAAVKSRIAAIAPQEYTRMGVAIRHITRRLKQQPARARLLIALSDGKPDDIDHYRGDYGIEDTRQALIEARHAAIHPFCITIDEHGAEYLPRMYGAVSYTVVDDVTRLPLKVADIYRRLTT